MFHLFFGIVWTAISIFIAFIMYNTNGTIEVNGRPVSHAEFEAMLWPKLFIGLFVLIGIIFICVGLKKIITNIITNTRGTETYGLVIDVRPSGTTVNGRPQLMADILIVVDGRTERYSEIVGFDWNKYRTGDFTLLKHYKKDVNLIRRVNANEVPGNIMGVLRNEMAEKEKFTNAEYADNRYMENPYQNNNTSHMHRNTYNRNESDW